MYLQAYPSIYDRISNIRRRRKKIRYLTIYERRSAYYKLINIIDEIDSHKNVKERLYTIYE